MAMFIYTVQDVFGLIFLALIGIVFLGVVVGKHLKKIRRKYLRK